MTTLQWFYQQFALPAEGQNAEPGDPVQKAYECVYACTSVALQMLGYRDTEPTDLMNLVHPSGHTGGETFDVMASYLRAHPETWPNLPAIALYNPPDTLAAIDAELAAGHILILDVYDDRSANILSAPLAGWGGTHAVMIEAKDASTTTVWNPWRGEQLGQRFPNAYIRGATLGPNVGNFFVFQRDIRAGGFDMLHPSLKRAICRAAIMAGTGQDPGSMEGLQAWADEITDDGSNADDIVALIALDPHTAAYRAAVASAISQPALTSSFALKDHGHQVTGSAK